MKVIILVVISLFLTFLNRNYAQCNTDFILLLNKYYDLSHTSDSNIYKVSFFETFPNSFNKFVSIYGWDHSKDKAYNEYMYSVSCEHIDKFYATIDVVPKTLYYTKVINISLNGHWDADAITCFQFNLRELFLRNTEQFLKELEFYTDTEIKSFWHFFFDNNIFNHPYNIERHKEVYKKIKALNNYTRVLTLMEEQYHDDSILEGTER